MTGVVGVYVGLFIEKSCYKHRAYCTLMFIDDRLINLLAPELFFFNFSTPVYKM